MTSILLLLMVLESACENDKKRKDTNKCNSSSDFEEFHCVNVGDFVSATGAKNSISQQIANCTVLGSTSTYCRLNILNFIGSSNASSSSNPTKQQILDRLIVSDPWMAQNFSSFLDKMPSDMYDLFSSVTAIVIHREIRPAFFWPSTGAIYIDPYYLWITPEQYNSISQEADYRSTFGASLHYESLVRYTKDGSYAFGNGNARTETQALYAFSALLFHELAHARDTFPITAIVSASPDFTPHSISASSVDTVTSKQLQNTFPLQSTTMRELAHVKFKGAVASANLIALTAADVGVMFALDGANDDYSYSTNREDTAMLFEEVMMKIHYNIDREIVFATPLNNTRTNCTDFSFDWVNINRYANANVMPRVTFAVNALLPNHNHANFLSNPLADGIFTFCQPSTAKPSSKPSSSVDANHSNSDLITRDHWD